MADDERTKPGLVQRLEAQRHRHRERPVIVRMLYVAAGFTVLAAGVTMLALPGPAFVVIPIGLALLSLEFAWAEGLLHHAIKQGEIAKKRAARTTKTQRALTAVAAGLAVVALAAWAVFGDIPLVPV
jgi:uncharacterized protein (TIGR02611 family)